MKKKATIHDVARAANCSIASVSRVLNTPDAVHYNTKRRVYEAILQVGYDADIPEEYKKKPKSRTDSKLILVLIPSIENPFYFDIVNGISSSAKRLGYSCILYQTGSQFYSLDEMQALVFNTHACGIILMHRVCEASVIDEIDKTTPIVQCCEYDETTNGTYVSIDDFSASKSLIEYMISRGKRKICLINSPKSFKYARQRQAGYEQALMGAGIPVKPEFILEIPDINFASALSIISQTLNREDKPDSFFAVSDVFAAAAIKACLKAGYKVPEDIGIVGFDNTYIATICTPSLTTVNQPRIQLGSTACELLMQRLNKVLVENKRILLETELIIRESL